MVSENLITTGIIRPKQWQAEKVQRQIATILQIKPQEIERLEHWPDRVWVKTMKIGAKFVSYRRLPIWGEEVLFAIKNSQEIVILEQLGTILRQEVQLYKHIYEPEILKTWQKVWLEKSQQFPLEESRLIFRLFRAIEASQWLEKHKELLNQCKSLPSLQDLFIQIEEQGEDFADQPEVIDEMINLWREKWKFISKADDDSIAF